MWNECAELIESVYGGFVNWEEEFFECPECGEPIYKNDWILEDYLCPVCDFNFETGEHE